MSTTRSSTCPTPQGASILWFSNTGACSSKLVTMGPMCPTPVWPFKSISPSQGSPFLQDSLTSKGWYCWLGTFINWHLYLHGDSRVQLGILLGPVFGFWKMPSTGSTSSCCFWDWGIYSLGKTLGVLRGLLTHPLAHAILVVLLPFCSTKEGSRSSKFLCQLSNISNMWYLFY
jgi:hypothetical protein